MLYSTRRKLSERERELITVSYCTIEFLEELYTFSKVQVVG